LPRWIRSVPASCAKAEALIRKAASQGAQIVCLPEPITPTPGPTITHFSALAKELGIYIILPMIEQGSIPGIIHNSAAFIDKKGSVQGVFRKVHAFATERYYFTAGNSYPVFNTEFGKVGIMICYDMGFPEVARILTLQGAEILFAPSAWCQEDEDIWDINIPARAIENQVFVAAVNRVGSEEDLVMHGKSKVVDTRGKTLVEAARYQEDLVLATVDLDTLLPARRQTPYLKDRKPHTYSQLTQIL